MSKDNKISASSDKLRHFPSLDPVTPAAKDSARCELSRQVDEFLAGGGEIESVHSSVVKKDPIIRNRKQQIAWRKKRNRIVRE